MIEMIKDSVIRNKCCEGDSDSNSQRQNEEWVDWKIERLVKKGDYIYAVVLNHPNRTKNNYVLHHRIVMENKLKRLLTKDELVHHINENKKDCSVDNVAVKTWANHIKFHNWGRTVVEIICPECSDKFVIPKNKTHLIKRGIFTSCSPRCRGRLSRYIQLYGISDDIANRINNSIVREYKIYIW